MNLLTKEEITRQLGKKSLFRKLPRTEYLLQHVSGIPELTSSGNTAIQTFRIERYPEGILLSDRKGKYRVGIPYSGLKNTEIAKRDDDSYDVIFSVPLSSPLVFSFRQRDRARMLPFIKLLPHREEGDPRDAETARREILQLKEDFATDYFTNCFFSKSIQGKMLYINKDHIAYGNKEVNTSEALGYALAIDRIASHGISRFEYKVMIHHPEKNMHFSFTSVGIFEREGEHTQFLQEIGMLLFDVVCRPIVARWFDTFANGESIESKEFSLTRQGIRLKTGPHPGVLIHWDEVQAYGAQLFRWPYSNNIFLQLDSSHDRRAYMLVYFILWLRGNRERLRALMGREYYVA